MKGAVGLSGARRQERLGGIEDRARNPRRAPARDLVLGGGKAVLLRERVRPHRVGVGRVEHARPHVLRAVERLDRLAVAARVEQHGAEHQVTEAIGRIGLDGAPEHALRAREVPVAQVLLAEVDERRDEARVGVERPVQRFSGALVIPPGPP